MVRAATSAMFAVGLLLLGVGLPDQLGEAARTWGTAAGAVLVAAGSLLVVGMTIGQRQAGRNRELRGEVCDLLRRLDDAEPHEDHAEALGRIMARRRALGALSENGEARRRREDAEAVAKQLNASIKECRLFALRATGSAAEGLNDFEVMLQRFADSWEQVREAAHKAENASGAGRMRPMTTREKAEAADRRAIVATERLAEARATCGRERELVDSARLALEEVWCRD